MTSQRHGVACLPARSAPKGLISVEARPTDRSILTVSQDGEVTVDEFKKAIQNNCTGKAYGEFPKAFKAFIEGLFRTVDIDGIIG